MTELDMRGQPCPIPVVQAKKALALPDTDAVAVLVDNPVAVQNLEKMAKGMGHAFAWQQQGDKQYRVQLQKTGATPSAGPVPSTDAPAGTACAPAPEASPAEGVTVLITGQGMGSGADELGRILIKGFVFSLTELSPPPKAVIFLNGGAHLTCQGANTVPDLQALAEKGTEILTCGTCANYFKLTDKLAVGSITDMMGITSRLAAAWRLITL